MPTYLFHLTFEISKPPVAVSQQSSDLRTADWAFCILGSSSTCDYSVTQQAPTEPIVCNREESEADRPPGRHTCRKEIDGGGNVGLSLSSPKAARFTRCAPNKSKRWRKLTSNYLNALADWRLDNIHVQSIDMEPGATDSEVPITGVGRRVDERSNLPASALATKGKYVPTNPLNTDLGCGVVHLYRDAEPSTDLDPEANEHGTRNKEKPQQEEAYIDENGTTLCILAVPSYMTPSDLLGWVGEDARGDISHFRLVRTSRSNKYMVLLKFREPSKAKQWQKNWNGKLFSSMEVNFTILEDENSYAHMADPLTLSLKTAMWYSCGPSISRPWTPTKILRASPT